MGLALFDLDRTLLDVNSGELWIHSEWRAGRVTVRQMVWAVYWLFRYHLGHGRGLDEVFRNAARALKGQPEHELDDRIRAWFGAEIQHRLRPGGLRALEKHRGDGDQVVLATSGTLYVARAAAEAFELDDIICTVLEVAEGELTGGISTLAVGDGKLTAVAEWAERESVDFREATFYSDSFTDVALMEAVRHPVAVNPDRKLLRHARRRNWPIVDWGKSTSPAPGLLSPRG